MVSGSWLVDESRSGTDTHMARWQEWSGANFKRRQAQRAGKSYTWYLEKGRSALDDRLVRVRVRSFVFRMLFETSCAQGSPRSAPGSRSDDTHARWISHGDSLRNMIAKDAPRTLARRDTGVDRAGTAFAGETSRATAEQMHIESVSTVLTALFGGRITARRYRQGISIVVAFVLTVARKSFESAARERGAKATVYTTAQARRNEAATFWLVTAIVEGIYPVLLDNQMLLAETTMTWRLLQQHLPRVTEHLSTLFGDPMSAEGGFTGLFTTKFFQTLCCDQFPCVPSMYTTLRS